MAGCCCGDESASNVDRKNVCCSDILFLPFFIAFCVGMVCIAEIAIEQGDPSRLLNGVDSFGNTCGQDNSESPIANVSNSGQNNKDEPYLFLMNLFMPDFSVKICVSHCPNETLITPNDVQGFYDKTGIELCTYNTNTSQYSNFNLYSFEGPCPFLPVMSSIPVLGRCLPDPEILNINMTMFDAAMSYLNVNKSIYGAAVSYLNKQELVIRKILADFYSVHQEIVYLGLIAIGFSILIIIFMKIFSKLVVYFAILISSVSSVAACTILWTTWNDLQEDREKGQKNFTAMTLEVDVTNEKAFLAFAIIMSVFTAGLLLMIFSLLEKIQLTIAILGESAKCITVMPLLLFTPLISMGIILAFAAGWVIVFTYINTIEKAVPFEYNGSIEVRYESLMQTDFFVVYYIVGGIWGLEFLVAAQQIIIVSAVAIWYFNRDKPQTPLNCIVCQAICRLILHHIGTIALGSFVIMLFRVPRYILMFSYSKLKTLAGKRTQHLYQYLMSCLSCVEQFLKYVNVNAYVVTAVEGKGFFCAASRASTILVNNALRINNVNGVGTFLFFCTKMAVVALTGTISIDWFKKIDGLHFYALPVIFASVLAFFYAHIIVNVYAAICDVILLCFCIDCEINDGSPEKPFYMDVALMSFVQNSCSKPLTNKPKEDKESKQDAQKNVSNSKAKASGNETKQSTTGK